MKVNISGWWKLVAKIKEPTATQVARCLNLEVTGIWKYLRGERPVDLSSARGLLRLPQPPKAAHYLNRLLLGASAQELSDIASSAESDKFPTVIIEPSAPINNVLILKELVKYHIQAAQVAIDSQGLSQEVEETLTIPDLVELLDYFRAVFPDAEAPGRRVSFSPNNGTLDWMKAYREDLVRLQRRMETKESSSA